MSRDRVEISHASGLAVPAIGNNFDDNEDIVKSSPAKSDAACLFIRENVILLKVLLFTLPTCRGKSILRPRNIREKVVRNKRPRDLMNLPAPEPRNFR